MPAGIGERCLEQSALSQTRERADDVPLALLLTYITLGWMTIEEQHRSSGLGFEKPAAPSIWYRQRHRAFQCRRPPLAFANRSERVRG